jgi:hypothetical protein
MPYIISRNIISDISWFDISKLPQTERNIQISINNPREARLPGYEHIGIQQEPETYIKNREMYIKNYKNFDKILAYDEYILHSCPNSIPYIPSASWLLPEDYETINIQYKKRQISSLTGSKNFIPPGHPYRQLLYFNQLNIKLPIPITWFRSSIGQILPEINNNPCIPKSLESKKDLFLDYQFSLVIENTKEKNMFTEKLIDCLITKTIPIYFGCTNITNWFNTTGWIILETPTIEEFTRKCQHIPNYEDYTNVINDNYDQAKKYTSFFKNVSNALQLA